MKAYYSDLLSFIRLFVVLLLVSPIASAEERPLRVGHFPNLTHAQALVAHQLSRQGKGWYESRIGAPIEWYVFNAGPSAMEAMLTGSLDLTFVGPNPALNAFSRTKGKDIRIIQGAACGGSALVVRKDAQIVGPADFKGKRIGTPQFGNTQDIAARAWLLRHGMKITQSGGDALVIPTQNPDQLDLLKRRELDAVWTVEPWVARLELDAEARVFLEDKEALTTVLAASVKALEEREKLVEAFALASRELSDWIVSHHDEAVQLVQNELKAETSKAMPPDLLEKAWGKLIFTSDLPRPALDKAIDEAQMTGFLPGDINVTLLLGGK